MFHITKVQVVSCEEKDWEIDGKKGKFYPTNIRIADKIFSITSRVDLRDYLDQSVDLELELQAKTPVKGNPYTGIRIIGALPV